MLAVSNTSPLRYLIAADHANLLFRLFNRVLVPTGVADELADAAAPRAGDWIAHPPAWLEVRVPVAAPDRELSASLDRGESEAIQLASECAADVFIIDEWKGRSIARARGLPVAGALGVPGSAYQRRFIDDPLGVLANMRRQGFRVSDHEAIGFAGRQARSP